MRLAALLLWACCAQAAMQTDYFLFFDGRLGTQIECGDTMLSMCDNCTSDATTISFPPNSGDVCSDHTGFPCTFRDALTMTTTDVVDLKDTLLMSSLSNATAYRFYDADRATTHTENPTATLMLLNLLSADELSEKACGLPFYFHAYSSFSGFGSPGALAIARNTVRFASLWNSEMVTRLEQPFTLYWEVGKYGVIEMQRTIAYANYAFPEDTRYALEFYSYCPPIPYRFGPLDAASGVAMYNLPVLDGTGVSTLRQMVYHTTRLALFACDNIGVIPDVCSHDPMLTIVMNSTLLDMDPHAMGKQLGKVSGMPGCVWTRQTAVREFVASFYRPWTEINNSDAFSTVHAHFGAFPDIERFQMLFADSNDALLLPSSFASNGKLRSLHLAFLYGDFSTLPNGTWQYPENFDSLYLFRWHGRLPDGVVDALPYSANVFFDEYTHARVWESDRVCGKDFIQTNGDVYENQVQCFDTQQFCDGVYCLPQSPASGWESNLQDALPFFHLSSSAVNYYDDAYALYGGDAYDLDYFIPSAPSDAEHIWRARWIRSALARSSMDVSYVGGLTEFNETYAYSLYLYLNSLPVDDVQYPVALASIDFNNPDAADELNFFVSTTPFTAVLNISASATLTPAFNSTFQNAVSGVYVTGQPLFADPSDTDDFLASALSYFDEPFVYYLQNQTIFQTHNYCEWAYACVMIDSAVLNQLLWEAVPSWFTPTRMLWLENMASYSAGVLSGLWTMASLQTLVLRASNFDDAVDPYVFDGLTHLVNVDLSDNVHLVGSFSDAFMNRPFDKFFNIGGTNILATLNATAPVCRSEVGFTCVVNSNVDIPEGCACVLPM